MNYTALGATVNLAARLEGLNKIYGTSILVSSRLKERVGGQFFFRSVDCISPKGSAETFRYLPNCEMRTRRLMPADANSAANGRRCMRRF